MSIGPCSASIRSTVVATASASATSRTYVLAVPPSPATSSAAAVNPRSPLAIRASRSPRRANSQATARPIPPLAPVMAISRSMGLSLLTVRVRSTGAIPQSMVAHPTGAQSDSSRQSSSSGTAQQVGVEYPAVLGPNGVPGGPDGTDDVGQPAAGQGLTGEPELRA